VLVGAGKLLRRRRYRHMKKSATYSSAQNFKMRSRRPHALHAVQLGKPTIACVRGAVPGGVGWRACDIVIAPRRDVPPLEVKLGVIPAMISPYVIAAIASACAPLHAHRRRIRRAEALRIGWRTRWSGKRLIGVGRMLAHLY